MSYERDLFEKIPWKFSVNFKNAIKLPKNIFCFEDNCGWTFCGNFSQLWQEYLSLVLTMLESAPHTSATTKRHDKQLNFLDINGEFA